MKTMLPVLLTTMLGCGCGVMDPANYEGETYAPARDSASLKRPLKESFESLKPGLTTASESIEILGKPATSSLTGRELRLGWKFRSRMTNESTYVDGLGKVGGQVEVKTIAVDLTFTNQILHWGHMSGPVRFPD